MGVSIRPPLMMLAVHPCLRPAVAGLTAGAGHAAAARKIICMPVCVARLELCCKLGACTVAHELMMWHQVDACNVEHELMRWRDVPAGVPIFPNDVLHHALFE